MSDKNLHCEKMQAAEMERLTSTPPADYQSAECISTAYYHTSQKSPRSWTCTATFFAIDVCPSPYRGCPILCGPHVSLTHSTDCRRKGWGYKISTLHVRSILESFSMPKGLRRFYGGGDLHFITCSCYQRMPFLGSASRRDLFLKIFEQVRQKYEFQAVGYVVMPEHIHLLIGEPDERSVALTMQVLKQRVARRSLARGRSRFPHDADPPPYPRSYDFNVFTEKKVAESSITFTGIQ